MNSITSDHIPPRQHQLLTHSTGLNELLLYCVLTYGVEITVHVEPKNTAQPPGIIILKKLLLVLFIAKILRKSK